MKTPKISAAIATYNEEENITDCINSLESFADEVVIADGSSEDKTRDIAQSLGAKVIKTTNKKIFNINKNLAIKNCSGDWIFLIDADERISEKLASEIKNILKYNPKENGYRVNRKNWFLGGFLTKGGAYPDSVIRLFRKGKGKLPEQNVHQQVQINGKVGYLKNDIYHLADPSFSRYLIRANRYSSLTSDEISKKNPGRGVVPILNYALFKPSITFLKIYLRHKGYKDGFRGFVWAFFSGFHYFLAYVKYWQKGTP